jgi:hypothetical protein
MTEGNLLHLLDGQDLAPPADAARHREEKPDHAHHRVGDEPAADQGDAEGEDHGAGRGSRKL